MSNVAYEPRSHVTTASIPQHTLGVVPRPPRQPATPNTATSAPAATSNTQYHALQTRGPAEQPPPLCTEPAVTTGLTKSRFRHLGLDDIASEAFVGFAELPSHGVGVGREILLVLVR